MNTPDDPAIRGISDALEREAALLRAEPDAGFEARVLRAALRAESEPGARVVIARVGFWRSNAFRIAAGLALLLTVGAVSVVALRGGSAPAPSNSQVAANDSDVMTELDAWLAMDDEVFGRTNLASFRSELDDADRAISYDDLGETALDAEDWM
jgi:hypothetical protein